MKKLIALLGLVGLFNIGCQPSHGDDPAPAPLTYVYEGMESGKRFVNSLYLNNGQFEVRYYQFDWDGRLGAFTKYTGTYSVSGHFYNVTVNYDTCAPSLSVPYNDTFTLTSTSATTVAMQYVGSHDITTFTMVADIETYLHGTGMETSLENLDCYNLKALSATKSVFKNLSQSAAL